MVVDNLLRGWPECLKDGRSKIQQVQWWSLPKEGFVKFNVDDAARGNPGLAGIEGVLHNHTGDIMLLGSKDSNKVELLAIRRAIFLWVGAGERELVI